MLDTPSSRLPRYVFLVALLLLILAAVGVSLTRTSSAAPISSLSQDTVEWLDSSKNIVTSYNTTSTTAVFFLADNDLETTPSGTATWTSTANDVAASGSFRITDGKTDDDGDGTFEAANAAASIFGLSAANYSTTSPATTPLTV